MLDAPLVYLFLFGCLPLLCGVGVIVLFAVLALRPRTCRQSSDEGVHD